MRFNLKTLKIQAKNALQNAKSLKELDTTFRAYLGKKGELTRVLRAIPRLPKSRRAKIGKEANSLKEWLSKEIELRAREFKQKEITEREKREWIDVTAPGKKLLTGHLHPLTQVVRKAQEIFGTMGFEGVEGPEIENEWYNFDALNIPPHHPARDMWDTFWIKDPEGESRMQSGKSKPKRLLLRTHTSPVQIRYMETHTPPLRIIVPGTVYRYEATDARHEFNFRQLEGLMIDRKVSAANFKAVIQEFYRRFFQKPVDIRLRPSYFPFTEPSFEVDMSCILCSGKGCPGCGNSGWLEMMGAGMVHPNVLKAVRYNPQNWQGFAFGMGLERLAMMRYKITDIRLFNSGDLRFLQQF